MEASASPGPYQLSRFDATFKRRRFLWNRPWTIAFPTRLLAGDWPSWTTHLYWYLLLAGTLVAFDRTGKNPYCPCACPFGAAQDVIGLAGGARRRRVPSSSG